MRHLFPQTCSLYGIDSEAIKAILGSTTSWTPAMQNGRQVRSYKKQPVIFKLQVR